MKFIPSFVIKPVNWPSTTPTTDNKAGSAREGLISPSIVKSVELELALCRWNSWPVWSGSSSQPAVHSNQFPGHPLSLLPTQVPGPQGWDWEWKGSFYVEVGWRNLKNSPPASDEKILELGWCDWCFTAEKSVPVRSDEECTFHKGNSLYIQRSKLRRLKFPVICICSTRHFYGDCSWKITEGTFKRHG